MTLIQYWKMKMVMLVGITIFTYGCTTVNRDWQEADQQGTALAYRQFIERHPDTEQAETARQQLVRIEMEQWQHAISLNTVRSYRAFLSEYPDTRYAPRANVKIQELIEAQAWKTAKSANTIRSYSEFFKRYPKSAYAANARRSLTRLKVAHDWSAVQKANTVRALEKFLKAHPTTEYTNAAKKQLELLRRVSAWKRANERDTDAGWLDYILAYPDSPKVKEAISRLRHHKIAQSGSLIPWETLGGKTFESNGDIYFCNANTKLNFSKWRKLNRITVKGHLQGGGRGFQIVKGMALIPE